VGWCGGKPNDFSGDTYAHKHMFVLHTSCSGSFAPLSPCFQAVSGLAGECCAGATPPAWHRPLWFLILRCDLGLRAVDASDGVCLAGFFDEFAGFGLGGWWCEAPAFEAVESGFFAHVPLAGLEELCKLPCLLEASETH